MKETRGEGKEEEKEEKGEEEGKEVVVAVAVGTERNSTVQVAWKTVRKGKVASLIPDSLGNGPNAPEA